MNTTAQPTQDYLDRLDVGPSAIPWGAFKIRHPEYDADYWRVCEALYAGGRKLFGDDGMLVKIFPQHAVERIEIYAERKRRAFYIPYAGAIIDHLVADLFTRPLEMAATPSGDAWHDAFFLDVSPPMGRRMSFPNLLKHQILCALKKKRAWALVDMPESGTGFASLAEQERAGALGVYVLPLASESVIDWQDDDNGELLWALTCTETARREDLMRSRQVVTYTYTHWLRDEWRRYEITHDKTKRDIQDSDPVPLVGEGKLAFGGRVPLVRLDLPDGLWAMSKLEGLAREHLNKRCALAWAEYKSLLPIHYEFLAPEDPTMNMPVSEAQQDPHRATTQIRGQGYVQIRGAGDMAKFIGPDTAPFSEARASCTDLRDEMHRVTHSMALSVDNSGAALQRSANSKQVDQASTAVVLGEIGRILREHAEDIMAMVSAGRGETLEWQASGMDRFSSVSTAEAISEALDLESIEIPSPTFRVRQKYMLAKSVLGDEAQDDDLEKIESELESSITAESLQPVGPPTIMPGKPGAEPPDDDPTFGDGE